MGSSEHNISARVTQGPQEQHRTCTASLGPPPKTTQGQGAGKNTSKPPPHPVQLQRLPSGPNLSDRLAAAYPNIFISFINSIPPYQPSGGNAGALATEAQGRARLTEPPPAPRGSPAVQPLRIHSHVLNHVLGNRAGGESFLCTNRRAEAGVLQILISVLHCRFP